MEQFEISAEPREVRGKGASRRLRRAGKVPAILYGADQEPTNLQLDHNDVLRHAEHEAFYSHVLTLKVAGNEQRVVIKDMQRHPYKPFITHMDFQRVSETTALTMRIPIHFINEDNCAGVKQQGGVISHQMSDLEIICLPKDLPEYVEVDVEALELGNTIQLGDLRLPDGVQSVVLAQGGDAVLPVVSVNAPRIEEVDQAPEDEMDVEQLDEAPKDEDDAAATEE